MITVEVVSIGGLAPPRPMSAQIDQRGGTVGRSPDCTLVLNDEKRAVSRIHAELSFRDGGYLVLDQGTNPLKVNGVPLGKGNVSAIRNGDRLNIGPYELEVREQGMDAPAADAAQDWGAAPAALPGAGAPSSSNPFDDLLGGSGSGGADPMADLGAPSSDALFEELGFGPASAPAQAAPSSPVSRPAAFGGSALPADFDPMAPPPAAPDPLPDDIGLDDSFGSLLGSQPKAPGEGSLDAMFGLSSGPGADPFASGPLGKPPPSHAGGTDSGLTQWIGGINKPTQASLPDQVPELNSAFQPPEAHAPTPLPDAQMLDLDAFGAPDPVDEPPAVELPAPPPPQMDAPVAPTPRPVRPMPPPPAASVQPRAAGPAAVPADLLEALMAGLNAPDLVIDDLTPELMFKIGALMHEATAGTVALLNARGTVKREMRADVTMIASGRNNPLKFSPDARLALRYLLGPPMPGFMEADEAMRDAYSDLRAHEFGFMAGLRAALSGVLKRFEPGQLESRLPEKGGINALVPMNRKAKLWDLFSELYRQIALEAEEDFHALFGREFLRAYEEHIAALERGQREQRRK